MRLARNCFMHQRCQDAGAAMLSNICVSPVKITSSVACDTQKQKTLAEMF